MSHLLCFSWWASGSECGFRISRDLRPGVPSFHSVSAGVGGDPPSKLLVTMDKPLSVSERLCRPRTDLVPGVLSQAARGKQRRLEWTSC